METTRSLRGVRKMSILSIQEIREKVTAIDEKYNLKAVYLFGSYARGEAREESDIDLLYVKKDNQMSLTTKYQMLEELEDSLGKSVDLVSLNAFALNEHLPGTSEILERVERDREELYVA
jgi:predicted nucleotidyltransferase